MALKGLRVIEMAGLAPAPFCGMILADFGAKVIRVDKVKKPVTVDVLGRGKRSIAIDLKQKQGVGILKKLCTTADVLIDSFRPGVMERLGLGPSHLESLNHRLIYARLSGYGQTGPLKNDAGHDINYLALSGVLSMLGRKGERPYAPINLLADFAGGGLTCALGIVLALYERCHSGQGQVIDCSMVEGTSYVGSWLWRSKELFTWSKERGENWLDGGVAFYDTYETKDGKYMSVGTIEPEFYSNFIEAVGLSESASMSQFGDSDDQANLREQLRLKFLQKTQEEWVEAMRGLDTCVAPVLTMEEAGRHPHSVSRASFLARADGDAEPRPAPLLCRTPGQPESLVDPAVGQHTLEILGEAQYTQEEISSLVEQGVVEQAREGDKGGIREHWSKL